MATLYRKYRPKNFKEVVNQNHVKLTLEHQIQSGRLAHAYLFCGPRAVGKTTLARVFAKALNCTERKEGTSEPCNKCGACESINNSSNLDIIEIDAASHTGVENVRESIIAAAKVSSSSAKYKVFIIDEVHMLSINAFNALLKIMEEPPAFVVFILCTTEVHKVPMTIISRCQRFDFKRLSVSDITKKLTYITKEEEITIDKKILESIARQSEGYMRDAESMLGQIVAVGGKEITQEEADLVIPRSDLDEVLNLLAILNKKDAASGIRLVNALLDEGFDLKQFTADFIEMMRRIMISKINPALGDKLGLELGESLELKLNKIGVDLDVNQLIAYIERFIEARNGLKNSFITQLPLELAIIELCYGSGRNENQNTTNFVKKNTNNPVNAVIKESISVNKTPAIEEVSYSSSVSSVVTGTIDKAEILNKWNEVLSKVKSYNHSLSFILRVCEPRRLDGNQLCLAFKYKFHRDRVGEFEIKGLIERTLNEVYGQKLIIEAIVDEKIDVNVSAELPPEKNASPVSSPDDVPPIPEAENGLSGKRDGNKEIINNLLKNFGGRIVK